MDPDPLMKAAPRSLGHNLDREEEALATALLERFGPEIVDSITAAKAGLDRAVQLYEDLESLAGEISATSYRDEFGQALEQVGFWSWGLSGFEDAVRARAEPTSERGVEHSS